MSNESSQYQPVQAAQKDTTYPPAVDDDPLVWLRVQHQRKAIIPIITSGPAPTMSPSPAKSRPDPRCILVST